MADQDPTQLAKLKVAELRNALHERKLDTKGTKPMLIQRLREAVESGNRAKVEEESEEGGGGKMDMDISDTDEQNENKDAYESQHDIKVETVDDESNIVKVKAVYVTDENLKEHKGVKTFADKSIACKNEYVVQEDMMKENSKGTKRKHEEDTTEAVTERPWEVREDEPDIEEHVVCLDWYNSDLNLRIRDDLMTCVPFHRDGWGWCYAGVRASHGVREGRAWYELRMLEMLKIWVQKDEASYDVRLGWSLDDSPLMLGEGGTGWGYSCSGKKVHGNVFDEYGAIFDKNDVIGSFIDFTSNDCVTLTWSKNGESLGPGFEIPNSVLKDKFLFPHVISRNVKFDVNFGQSSSGEPLDNWASSSMPQFTKIANLPTSERGRGATRIKNRADCSLIMMVGLPASGKTIWARNFMQQNKEKMFNLLSTEEFMKKMTVNGESRQHHCGKMRYEHLVQRITRNMQDVVRVASTRRRNIIIDQTNVYENAQKRKVRPFTGMSRSAVVVVPSDVAFKGRREKQKSEDAGARSIPEEAVMEMKANFSIPKEGEENFNEILFVELARKEAEIVVGAYNKDAKEKGFGKKYEKRREYFAQRFSRGRGPGGQNRATMGGRVFGWEGQAGNGHIGWGGNRGGSMGGGFGMGRVGWGGFGVARGFGMNGHRVGEGSGGGSWGDTGGFRQGYPGSRHWGGGWSGF